MVTQVQIQKFKSQRFCIGFDSIIMARFRILNADDSIADRTEGLNACLNSRKVVGQPLAPNKNNTL